jgi:predicted Zn-dependent protease
MKTALIVATMLGTALASTSCETLISRLVAGPPPCYDDGFERCQEAQQELAPLAHDSCDGAGRRVCLVPLGRVSPDLVEHLVEHFPERYGLEVAVLRPLPVPDRLVDTDREQIRGSALIEYMRGEFPGVSWDSNAVLIGLTPLDLYFEKPDPLRFAFGVKGTAEDPKAVASTFRMNPETYEQRQDDGLLHARARKMVSRYVGLLYYGLALRSDPSSVLYESIGGLSDLDRIGDSLPVPKQR